MEQKACRECGGEYDGDMFFAARNLSRARGKICHQCSLLRQERKKWENRFYDKARGAVRRHAKNLGIAVKELIETYGWDPKKMAHDIQHTFDNWCPYCGYPFAEMAHGLWDLTLDIYDQNMPPLYTNTRWVCSTCNSIKQNMGPERWGRYTVYLAKWRAQQERLKKNPFIPLPLFKDLV